MTAATSASSVAVRHHGSDFVPRRCQATLLLAVLALLACPSAAAFAAGPGVPPPMPLTSGWQFSQTADQGTLVPLAKWEAPAAGIP